MNLEINQFTYNFEDGKITSAQIGLYGTNNPDAEYVNASIRVKPEDLPEGKSFMAMGMPDMIAIARKKLMAGTKAEEATDTTQPVTKAEEVKDQQ